jgi:tripartite-type tricarboxylate transporter receptor subunit TctC
MQCRNLVVAILVCLLPLATYAAQTQEYPNKPVRMLVGWPPGGTVDLIGRVVAQLLTEKLHQQVIVDNRLGASGMIVDQMIAAAAPDGYSLQTAGSTHATNPSLYAEAKYHPVKDFTPITLVASTPYVLVFDPKLPVKNVAEFSAFLQRDVETWSKVIREAGITAN